MLALFQSIYESKSFSIGTIVFNRFAKRLHQHIIFLAAAGKITCSYKFQRINDSKSFPICLQKDLHQQGRLHNGLMIKDYNQARFVKSSATKGMLIAQFGLIRHEPVIFCALLRIEKHVIILQFSQ
jgi:hypothetical protein